MSSPVEVRELTKADLEAVTRVHNEAFPESAMTSLGSEAVRRYYEWLLLGPHDGTAIGAWEGDRLLGFCFGGVFRGAMSGFLRRNRAFLALLLLTRPWLLGNETFRGRATSVWSQLNRGKKKPPPPPTGPPPFGILAIGVDARAQGKGVGRALMEYSENAARQSGFSQMWLSVRQDNHQAVAFYERLGWVKVLENGVWNGRLSKQLEP